MFRPFFTYSAPIPLGAWILWPLTEIRSAPSPRISVLHNAWTASVWSRAFFFDRAMSRMGMIVPVSLFTVITEIKTVLSSTAAAISFGSTLHMSSTPT